VSNHLHTVSWQKNGALAPYVCGIGARTPLGLNAAASAAAVRGAISAVRVHPSWKDKVGKGFCIASDAVIDEQLSDTGERFKALASAAIAEALENTHLDVRALPIFLALPSPRPGLPEHYVQHISQFISTCRGYGQDPVFAYPLGHAAGLIAMQYALQKINSGELEIALVVAVDSYINLETLKWLDDRGQLMSIVNRNGFPPSEGAAACLIATKTAANRFGLSLLAQPVATALAMEPNPMHSEGVSIGLGLSAIVKDIINHLPQQELISLTYCDLNGERYRNEEFGYTLLRTQLGFRDAHDYLTPADCWGDMGAASGILFMSLAIQSKLRGYAKGPLPLCWVGSESGQRAAILLNLQVEA